MKLQLKRRALKPTYTIGTLYVDGVRFCDTLEDTVRDLTREAKIPGRTAIPAGTYDVTLSVQSPRFRDRPAYRFCSGFLPRLVGVPHFEGVLIHIGNSPDDTEGCILVGENKAVGRVMNSTAAFQRLYTLLKAAAVRGERIQIEIR